MSFKFEKLEVWELAVQYIDCVYKIAAKLPHGEDYNLKSQITRSATSIALNIAEGSTTQTDSEQSRFLGIALRSVVESVACLHLIKRRKYINDEELRKLYILKRKTLCQAPSFP
jgi:four helix bundle protein